MSFQYYLDFDKGLNSTLTYSIMSGNDNSLFKINPQTGLVQVSKGKDFSESEK